MRPKSAIRPSILENYPRHCTVATREGCLILCITTGMMFDYRVILLKFTFVHDDQRITDEILFINLF